MIGKNIKKLRKAKRLSVRKLASISGVHYSYISALELGIKDNPSLNILIKIAKGLGVEVDELFSK